MAEHRCAGLLLRTGGRPQALLFMLVMAVSSDIPGMPPVAVLIRPGLIPVLPMPSVNSLI